MKISLLVFLSLLAFVEITLSQEKKNPSFEEIISLQSTYNPEISPDGRDVLFQRSAVDWKENKYDYEIWISRDGKEPYQLTNSPKHSSTNPQWSPDGNWISFVTNADGKNQIHVMRSQGSAPFQVTFEKNGVGSYEWSPDGTKIAFLQSEDKEEEKKKRKDKYGDFAVEDGEYSMNFLSVIDFVPDRLNTLLLPEQMEDSVMKAEMESRTLLDSSTIYINKFRWSHDGKFIAIEHQPDPLINSSFFADISIFELETKQLTPLVQNPSYDGLITWSPDDVSILYSTDLEDTLSNYYKNAKLFRVDKDGSNQKRIAAKVDGNISVADWNEEGIFGLVWQKTKRKPLRINPKSGKATELDFNSERIWDISFSKTTGKLAFTASNDMDLTELYISDYPVRDPKRISNYSDDLADWLVAQSEVITWKSKDGAEIEGVLQKPLDFDPNKQYPLLVMIHGGPTGISIPHPTSSYVYPMVQLLNKGAIVLRPNYRGSEGYGEEFRSLNVKNLGVGDAWDVESGVRYLEKQGYVDMSRVAAMGWSQGGYISAFLATNSDLFKAISVGAGISNWMTYYVNTDIHPFTRQYLKATPWSDKSIYEKTSPMTNINNAKTPTLIQHGEFDRRVPIANAYELFQGLQDVGVPTKLIVYKGFGHGINKPKERLAAVWHNWQWINKYLWDEEIELPED